MSSERLSKKRSDINLLKSDLIIFPCHLVRQQCLYPQNNPTGTVNGINDRNVTYQPPSSPFAYSRQNDR